LGVEATVGVAVTVLGDMEDMLTGVVGEVGDDFLLGEAEVLL
jgi:hypothetical protein